jgi:hypothetical protein
MEAIPIDSLYEVVNNQVSQLWVNTMPLCGQHFVTDPYRVSPASVAVVFLPPSMDPINH